MGIEILLFCVLAIVLTFAIIVLILMDPCDGDWWKITLPIIRNASLIMILSYLCWTGIKVGTGLNQPEQTIIAPTDSAWDFLEEE